MSHQRNMSESVKLEATKSGIPDEEEDRLFSTLRTISEDFSARDDESKVNLVDVHLLPSFSNISLWVVWFVCVVSTATCYLFCEVHQVSYPSFPLEFVAGLGAQLTLVSSCLVYVSGVHRYGRHVYRLYQPFSGGVQFVSLQGLGSLCLSLSLCILLAEVMMFDVHHIVRGAFLYCALLSLLGSALLMSSIAWFDPRNAPSTRTSFMGILSRKPNAETALSMCLLAALLGLCLPSYKFPALQPPVTILSFLIHLVNGALIHFVIGSRYTAGYHACLTLSYVSTVSAQLWSAWLTFFATAAANVYLISHRTEHSHMWLVGIVFGNVLSGGILLLFIRFTKFQRPPSNVNVSMTSIAQYGGGAAVVTSLVLAITEFVVALRLQALKEASATNSAGFLLVNRHVESSDWTWGELLQLWLFVSKSVSILLPPLTQIGGRVVHGSKFMWFAAPIGPNYRAFVMLQVAGGWLYIVSCGFFGLFVLTDSVTFGAVMSLTNVFSVVCITMSIQEFTRVEERGTAAASPTFDARQGPAPLPSASPTETDTAPAAAAPPLPELTLPAPGLMNASLTTVLNGTLLLSYLLAASGLALRVLLDTVRTKLWDSDDSASQGLLFSLSSACFVLATPVAHYSARQLGMKTFDPFHGGGSYVALQVLGWGVYAVLLILKALAIVAWRNDPALPGLRAFASAHEGYWFTMFGVLDFIPLILITLSNMVEARRALTLVSRRETILESLAGVRSIMHSYAARCHNDDERALARRAFRTVAACTYDTYRLPYLRADLELLPEDEALNGGVHTGGEAGSREDSDDLFVDDETRVRHESVVVIVILMACFSAAFYTIAAFTWNIPIVSLSMASCGFVICAVSCIMTHAGYGVLLQGDKGFKPFMPFRGGTDFLKLQVAGWTCFTCVLLITLTSVVETVETSVPALLTAATLSIAAQVLLLDSIPRFTTKEPASYFLEHNSEVIVAVLCFVGAITFGNVYSALKNFVTSSDESITARRTELGQLQPDDLSDDGRWVSTKRTRVPFVVAIVGVTLAVPLVLMALGRTTRQAGLVAREKDPKRSSLVDDDDDDENEESRDAVDGSPRHRGPGSPSGRAPSGYTRWANRGVLLGAFSNLMQVLLMLAGAVLPFTVGYLLYSFSHSSMSAGSLENIEVGMWYFALVLLVSLVLSLVPYLLHVGVPHIFITLRFTIVTWAQYGLAVTIACSIILPAFVFPCMGTITSAVLLFALTLVGNFSMLRLLLRMILSALIGYRTYVVYTQFRQNGLRAACAPAALGAYVCDEFLLAFWVWYIPTYDAKPYHTGRMRSERVIDFARRYIFSDVVRYFKFSIVVDDASVQLRDGKNQYIFSFHPHGVFPGTALFCSMTEEWERKIGTNPDNCLCTHVASIIFNVPGVRDYNLLLGSISVARRSIEASLARGNSAVIVTGGQAEMLHTKLSNTEMILVTQHMGFIRLAMKSKVPLVPLLSFAENNLLGLMQFPRIQKITLKILGFPFPFVPFGRFGLPVPFRTRLTLVVGKPVPIPIDADPENPDDVKRVADLYFAELKELFYRRRAEAGYPDMELVLVNDKEERRKHREAAEKAKAEKAAKKQQ